MPGIKREKFYGDDRRWLGETSGLAVSKTVKIKPGLFAAPKDYIPSGTAVALVDGVGVPYDNAPAVTTGAGVLYGLLATDITPAGDDEYQAVAVIDRGRILEAYLPAPLNYYANAAKAARTAFIVE